MSAHQEVEEHVHHATHPFDKMVAGSMAIIAALLAIVSVLGQRFNTEKLLNQQLASDQWAYYQGKDVRRYVAQATQDTLIQMKADPQLAGKYRQDAKLYRQQTADIQRKALEFERESHHAGDVAERFHFGEVFLEIAIVFSSLAILTRRKPLFVGGVVSALVGIAIVATVFWA
jgi:hypothetical protein